MPASGHGERHDVCCELVGAMPNCPARRSCNARCPTPSFWIDHILTGKEMTDARCQRLDSWVSRRDNLKNGISSFADSAYVSFANASV